MSTEKKTRVASGEGGQEGPGSALAASEGPDRGAGPQEDASAGAAAPGGQENGSLDDPWLRGYRAGLKAGRMEVFRA